MSEREVTFEQARAYPGARRPDRTRVVDSDGQTLPALVREADDRETLQLGLVENVARENLSAVEEARAYASLLDEFELSLGEVAERVGRSKPAVSNRVRLLELPEEVLWMLARGELTEGHARAVLALPDDHSPETMPRPFADTWPSGRTELTVKTDKGPRVIVRRVSQVSAIEVRPDEYTPYYRHLGKLFEAEAARVSIRRPASRAPDY